MYSLIVYKCASKRQVVDARVDTLQFKVKMISTTFDDSNRLCVG